MLTPRRLPGIQMDVAPPPAVEALPRMDIAVFVGFASTGPLHLPVAIESAAQFASVFGTDAPLAWDAQRGARVQALLGPTVRAFFANGGQRCWVVRVARTTGLEAAAGRAVSAGKVLASTSRFALPGVLTLPAAGDDGEAGPVQAATVAARCAGSWADALRVDTALQRRGLALQDWSALDSPPARHLALRTHDSLRPGDLLLLGDETDTCAYARVQTVTAMAQAGAPRKVMLDLCAAFERLAAAALPSPEAGQAQVPGFTEAVAAHWLPATLPGDARNPQHSLQFDAPVTVALQAGHWLRWQDSTQVLWLRMDSITRTPIVESPPTTEGALVNATASGPCWRELGPTLPAALGLPTRAQLLTLELRAFQPGGAAQRLVQLALTPQRPGNFWEQQSDADFYQPDRAATVVTPTGAQRFTLAAEATARPLAWLPLGVQAGFGAGLTRLPQPGSALERDGLADCNSELFIDPALAHDSVDALLAHADALRLINAPTRALFGMHAALGLGAGGLFNEPSLLSLPDAIHIGWQRASATADAVDGSGDSQDWLQNNCEADALEPHWLAVHRAALRLAAASGDWLAVLSLPRHFRSAQALRYTERLRSVQDPHAPFDAQAFAASEARALSYGALYFPWLQSDGTSGAGAALVTGGVGSAGTPGRAATRTPLLVPPDGVAVGVLAARSLRRGAWVAPANEAMQDVVALYPAVGEGERQALQDAQINLLRADPRGFCALSADTLATDEALRPINVRRLLMLLRRLVLQRGTRYVFEPHGAALRRAVQRGFDELLTDLFQRGAFAGATAAQSFRVVTDDTLNTPQSVDAGRLVVELRVAPSLPLRFMAVRLAQVGERLSLAEEL